MGNLFLYGNMLDGLHIMRIGCHSWLLLQGGQIKDNNKKLLKGKLK